MKKTMIVAATKDRLRESGEAEELAAYIKRRKLEFHAISAVTGQGIDELKWSLARHLRPTEAQRQSLLLPIRQMKWK